MNASHRYYISSGEKNGYYTLRHIYTDRLSRTNEFGSVETVPIYRDDYVCNLATEWNRALTKAESLTTKKDRELMSREPFELTPFGRNRMLWQYILTTVDPYSLPFGRYAGRDMREIAGTDPEYLFWMLDTMYSKGDADSRYYRLIPKRVALALLIGEQAEMAKAAKVREKAERDAVREAAKRPAPVGRVTIHGKVIKLRDVDSDWGHCKKMTVACDGFAVYGTMPSGLGAEIGDEVEFTATIERSPDDQSFGFFRRPTKSQIVSTSNSQQEVAP